MKAFARQVLPAFVWDRLSRVKNTIASPARVQRYLDAAGYWNEAMLVRAFLCFNSDFRIVMSTPLIRHLDEAFLQNRIPFYESIDQPPTRSAHCG
jgi:hypothetical protein